MSQKTLTSIIERASSDEHFRAELQNNFEELMGRHNWELTEQEVGLLKNMKVEGSDTSEHSLDERVSKAIYGTDTHSVIW